MSALWMLAAAFLFSVMGVCIKFAASLYGYNTAEIVFYRSLIGLITMWVWMRKQGEPIYTHNWSMHLHRSILGVTAMALFFAAITQLPLATAIALSYTSPIWIAIILALAPLVRKRHRPPDEKLLIAVFISFVGVICLLQPTIENNQLSSGLFALLGGLMAAFAYLTVRELGQRGESETRTVFYLSAVGIVASALWMSFSDLHTHTPNGILLLSGVGISATLAQLAMTRAYRLGNTILTANLQYTGVVFSAFWGRLIWHDHLNIMSWIGILLIICSGIASTLLRPPLTDDTPSTPT